MPCSWFLCVVVDPKGERRGWILLFLFLILVLWLWLRAFCFFETCLVCVRAREGVILLFVSRILPLLVPILFCSDPSHTAPILFEAPSFFFPSFRTPPSKNRHAFAHFYKHRRGTNMICIVQWFIFSPLYLVPRFLFLRIFFGFSSCFEFDDYFLGTTHAQNGTRKEGRHPLLPLVFFLHNNRTQTAATFYSRTPLHRPTRLLDPFLFFLCVLLSPLEQQFNPPKHKKTLAQPTNHYAQKSFFFSSRASHTQQLWKEREIRGGC